AAVLATALGADVLLLLTDVPVVYQDYGTARARPIGRITPDGLKALDFAAGSMGPKVEAAARVGTAPGGDAGIRAPTAANELVAGTAGTGVVPRLTSMDSGIAI